MTLPLNYGSADPPSDFCLEGVDRCDKTSIIACVKPISSHATGRPRALCNMQPNWNFSRAVCVAGLTATFFASSAHADEQAKAEDKTSERRYRQGVVLGTSFGAAVGGASGYPNDVKLLGKPDYYGATSLMAGTSFSFSFMGALTDYLNVGFFGSYVSLSNKNWNASSGGGGIRLELYPFVVGRPPFISAEFARSLGTYGDFGVGSISTELKVPGNYEQISGVQSLIALGAFYEFMLGRHVALAPDLRYQVATSRPADLNALVLSARFAWYPGND